MFSEAFMTEYDVFSKYYDSLMQDIDYCAKTEYALELFKKFGKVPTLLLDVGCGTGGFSFEFAKKGIDVIGADISEGMLTVAKQRAKEKETDILFLNQSAAELDLYGTVDGAVCFMDTINHIVSKSELQKSFNRISLFLEKDALFVFDVNTPYKHSEILGDNTFVFENDEVFCVWQNFHNKRNGVTDIFLDFFEKSDDNYIRNHDEFCERAYTFEELTVMREKTGFKTEKIYGEDSFVKPSKTSQRAVFVARKVR